MRHFLAVIPLLAALAGSGIPSFAGAATSEPVTQDAGKTPVVVQMPGSAPKAGVPVPPPAAASTEPVTQDAGKTPVVVQMPGSAPKAGVPVPPPAAASTEPVTQDAGKTPVVVQMPGATKGEAVPSVPAEPEAAAPAAPSRAPVAPLPQSVSPAPTPAPTPFNAASAPSAYQTQRLTARNFFAILPTGIFEVTPEGLDERQKQELLVKGQTDFWELAGETDDVIVFTALPFRDSGVAVRLFRNVDDGSVLAAIGTLGGEMCTVELWRMDRNGRTIPVDTPQEPAVKEFFDKGAVLPRNINPSVSICLGRGGLVARPIFWNASGMVHMPLAHDVSYQWDGHRFQKLVQAHRPDEANGEF